MQVPETGNLAVLYMWTEARQDFVVFAVRVNCYALAKRDVEAAPVNFDFPDALSTDDGVLVLRDRVLQGVDQDLAEF